MTALRAEGCGIALTGDEYKVSVTGFTFSAIWHSKHSADWLAALASPYPAAPDFPLFRGQNKTPRNTLFISISTVSTGYCAPSKRGKRWWRQPPKGECISSPAGRLYGFRRQRRYKKWRQRRRTSPVGTVSQPIGKPFNGQAKGLLWLTWRSYAGPPQYFIPPEGGALNPSGRR